MRAGDSAALDLRASAVILLSAAVWAAIVFLLLCGSKSPPGYDAYYHAEFSRLMMERGGIIRDFPWGTCSIWAKSFYDKDLLFHVYLIPFIAAFGKLLACQISTAVLAFVMAVVIGLLLHELGLRRHIFISLMFILLISGPVFIARLVLCRSYLMSIIFLILGILFIFRRYRWPLLLTAYVYSLSYTASWQLFPAALILDIIRMRMEREKFSLKNLSCLWILGGVAAGFLLTPYFPDNIYGSFAQTILVLKAKWLPAAGTKIIQASELQPMTMDKFLTGYLMLFAAYGWTLWLLASGRRRITDWRLAGLLALSLLYLFPTLLSMRFGEYFIPLSASFLCVFWGLDGAPLRNVRRKIIVVLILFIIGTVSFQRVRSFFYRDHLVYEKTCQWMNSNLAPGETVFTGDWDDSAIIFYSSPGLKYLVFLEPYFMYADSPRKYRLWRKICSGKMETPSTVIKAEFKARAVFVPQDTPGLRAKLLDDPFAKPVFAGQDGEALFILDVPEKNIQEYEFMMKMMRGGKGAE